MSAPALTLEERIELRRLGAVTPESRAWRDAVLCAVTNNAPEGAQGGV